MHLVQRLFVGESRQVVFTAVAPMHGADPGQSRFELHFGFAMACRFKTLILSTSVCGIDSRYYIDYLESTIC